MGMCARRVAAGLLMGASIVGLPVLGAWVRGRDLRGLLQFPPPLRIPREYLHFSWLAACAVVGALAALFAFWTVGVRRRYRSPRPSVDRQESVARRARTKRFPWWGYAALVWTCFWWWAAWNRPSFLGAVVTFTFFPLWIGFVVTVNAATCARFGTCLLLRNFFGWLRLFAASALFWWIFEWLNRFVENWHYLGVGQFGAARYAFQATLCFSTVLPAVAAVAEWLGTRPKLAARLRFGAAWPWLQAPRAGVALIVLGAVGLFLTGAFPRACYAALWSAPLFMLMGEKSLNRRAGFVAQVADGNWSRAGSWILAGLICGFFWEMWNVSSNPKWIYTVPGVDRWHIFEMPLLGYSGYLPFGLECLCVAEWLGIFVPLQTGDTAAGTATPTPSL